MKVRRAIAVVVVLGLAAAAVWWLVERSAAEREVVLGGAGIIEVTEVQVGSQQPGQLTFVGAKEGGQVKRGQVVARVDSSVLADQARAAKAAVDAAAAAVEAAKDEDDDAKVDKARADLRQAQAQHAIARTQLSQTTVKSPVAGAVLDVAVQRGEVVSVGQTLITVGDLARPRLVVFVPEPLIARIKLGKPARITVDGLPGREFAGKVSEVAQQAEFTPTSVQTKEQRTKLVYGVTLSLENPGMLLKPGMPADAVIEE